MLVWHGNAIEPVLPGRIEGCNSNRTAGAAYVLCGGILNEREYCRVMMMGKQLICWSRVGVVIDVLVDANDILGME